MLVCVGVVCFLVFPCDCSCILCHFPLFVLFRCVDVGVVFVLDAHCIVLVLCVGLACVLVCFILFCLAVCCVFVWCYIALCSVRFVSRLLLCCVCVVCVVVVYVVVGWCGCMCL